ncbi:MAG TPA: asparagine synthase (glutamine-hydrolyzing) [Pyrinomonadaceae bacterium]|nr:asparagine synthase (glutamine-hydrolyzing) [Pyrinomonadaceae bacterium]
MCGIAGLVATEPAPRVSAMLGAIGHRGRDDEGLWAAPAADLEGRRACLGHRRLAIIDPGPAGHQPFVSGDGRFVLTYNGELYNFRELRSELEARGHSFRTDCDTEVLLAAFAEWGEGCLSRLNGMFAFAVWDERERRLTLVRDRLGVKPLYYSVAPPRAGRPAALAFGSEIKAVLASGLVETGLDFEGLHQQLTFLWTPDPQTLFKNVRKLPPGHLLVWREGDVSVREWWDVSFDEVEEGRTDEWWRERTLETLDRAVGMEMVSDVPLGSFLSGGVDSSVVTALMARHSGGRRVSTYTVGIEPEDLRYDIIPDDARWARQVGQLLDTDYHETTLRPDVAELLPFLVRHLEMPVIDMAIPSYLVSRQARETLTVMLSGMGGDELFAGYPRQVAMQLARWVADPVPSSVRRPVLGALAGALPGGLPGRFTALFRNAKKFARSAAHDFEERYLGFGTYFDEGMKRSLYADELGEATRDLDPYQYHRRHFERARRAAPLNRLLYLDLKTFLPCLNLDYTDKTSMAATLEVRVPLLNHELVELSARMPPRLKLRGLKRKYILKRAAETLLPREVVWRKKAGFGAPVRAWLRGPLRPLVDELLSEDVVRRRGLFRPEAVRGVVEANLSGREDYSLHVLHLLTLEMWHREFIDRAA